MNINDIQHILSDHSPFVGVLDNYRPRVQQQLMADQINQAIKQNYDLICEAGTGTGKTLAYLLPLILSRQKAIVSTATKHLQDQLYQKDLPAILNALGLAYKVMVLKGRSNYLCLYRLELIRHETRNKQWARQIEQIRTWEKKTQYGDINELPDIEEHSGLRLWITSTTDNCLGQSCEFYDKCYLLKNRKLAMEAELVITNHHLLLADMVIRNTHFGELLPLADVIVFDEAHQLPELATHSFSQHLGMRHFRELVGDIKSTLLLEVKDQKMSQKHKQAIIKDAERLFKVVQDIYLLFPSANKRMDWQQAIQQANFSKQMSKLLERMQTLLEVLENIKQESSELDHIYQRAQKQYDFLEQYMSTSSANNIRWFETTKQHFIMHQTPANIAEVFQAHIQTYHATHIFTSATLAVKDDFSHFATQLGLSESESHQFDSPFNYEQQTRLYVPLDLPLPSEPDFKSSFISLVYELLSYSKGHAFLLFTTHQMLSQVKEILTRTIEYPLFVQGDMPRAEMMKRFRQTQNAVLLGTSSFWEGVDICGKALRLVIIDKLPFAPPDDPIMQARLKHIEEQGANPFMDYQLPQAVIALKQGVGRLIRDINDYGVCVICDKRIQTKAYGKTIQKSLPPMPLTHNIKDIEQFFIDIDKRH